MMNTGSGLNAGEVAVKLAQLVQAQEQLKAAGADSSSLDLQILPFKNVYVLNGAMYGANSAGMVRWFTEAKQDAGATEPRAAPPAEAGR